VIHHAADGGGAIKLRALRNEQLMVVDADDVHEDTGVHVCPELDEWEMRHGIW